MLCLLLLLLGKLALLALTWQGLKQEEKPMTLAVICHMTLKNKSGVSMVLIIEILAPKSCLTVI